MGLKILIAGGSGYLGQHLCQHLASHGHKVRYTFNTTDAAELEEATKENPVKGYQANFATGEGLDVIWSKCKVFDVVINCAAVSQPRQCEADEEGALAINVPRHLVAACQRQREEEGLAPLFVHFSTDQVYDGSSKPGGAWAEGDPTGPVNAYGRTKLAGERFLQESWDNHVILRCSLIVGRQPPVPVSRPLFAQFVEEALRERRPTEFAADEYRSPIFVQDICHTVNMLLVRAGMANHTPLSVRDDCSCPLGFSRLINLGGPERLSRLDMALAVARAFNYDTDSAVPSTSGALDRGYASPLDISMDVSRLTSEIKIPLTRFEDALRRIFSMPESPPRDEPSGAGAGEGAGAANGAADENGGGAACAKSGT